MQSKPQNPKYRNNPENFHPCGNKISKTRVHLNLCIQVIFLCLCICLPTFFKIYFSKMLTLLQYQTVWIQIRTDILSALIWVQTVCKGYQQMAKVTASKKRIKFAPITKASPDKSVYCKTIFFMSHPKHMLWVLKRTVSMRRFF